MEGGVDRRRQKRVSFDETPLVSAIPCLAAQCVDAANAEDSKVNAAMAVNAEAADALAPAARDLPEPEPVRSFVQKAAAAELAAKVDAVAKVEAADASTSGAPACQDAACQDAAAESAKTDIIPTAGELSEPVPVRIFTHKRERSRGAWAPTLSAIESLMC